MPNDASHSPDTGPAALARYLEAIRGIRGPERFLRALALSALVREMAWKGATRRAGELGEAAVVERFMLQVYGPRDGPRMMALLRGGAPQMLEGR